MPRAQDDSQDVLVPREAWMLRAAAQERQVIDKRIFYFSAQISTW